MIKLVKTSYFIIIIGILLLSVTLYLFLIKSTISTELNIDTVKFNDFGSFLSGTVGIIWSLAGTFLLVESLREQRKATMNNMRQIRVQQFENIFFQLIEAHNEIVSSIRISIVDEYGQNIKDENGRSILYEGVAFFEKFAKSLKAEVAHIDEANLLDGSRRQDFENILEERFYVYNSSLGHYYGNIYSIMQCLNDFRIHIESWNNRDLLSLVNRYRNIIISQLSNYEIIVMAYFNLIPENKYLLSLIEKLYIFEKLNSIIKIQYRMAYKWNPTVIAPNFLLSVYSNKEE